MRVSPHSPNIERDTNILEAIDSGKSFAEVARMFGISGSRVSQIKIKADRLEEAGRSFDISIRLINAMKNEGFLEKYNYPSVPSDADVMAEMQGFYKHITEVLPDSKSRQPRDWTPQFRKGPRWKRMPNFGPKTFEEVKQHLGITKEPASQEAHRYKEALLRIQEITRKALEE